MTELQADLNTHHRLYRLLGIDAEQGELIERHQNVGRLLWNNLGGLIEEAVKTCFRSRYPDAAPGRVAASGRARGYQIDLIVDRDAYEIKWRDATTDGDHDKKERARLGAISDAGFRPVKLMFYLPQRAPARRIQERLAALYLQLGGICHVEDAAWRHVHERTGVDLGAILTRLAEGDEP